VTAAAPGRPRQPGADTARILRWAARGSAGSVVAWVLVCAVVAAAAVLLTPRPSTDAAVPVSYQGDLAALRRIAPYPVVSPRGLPAPWQPVSSRLTGRRGALVSWHLGFVTPSGQLASLEESNERPAEFIRRMTNSGNLLPPVPYGGAEWARRWRPDKDQRSLYHSTPGGPTLVVTGDASWAELQTLLASLAPQRR
jgi:hypothetical protein